MLGGREEETIRDNMINIGPQMVRFILQGCCVIRVASSLDLPVGFRFLCLDRDCHGCHGMEIIVGTGRRGKHW